jgi:glycine C-acetyltransferase
MGDLERQLKENQHRRLKLIVSDGVFSMDGSITPLRDMCQLAERYEALIFLDECHTTGFLGATGRGTEEHAGLVDKVTIINSTLGKALGGAAGGYTTGSKELISLLRQRSRPYLFSNSLPPAVVAAASKVLDLLMNGSELVHKLQNSTKYFRSVLKDAGFSLKGDDHPIVPVMLGDARLAAEFADEMLEKGIYVIGFSYPVVPQGEARIRVQISALHTRSHLDQCLEAFIEIGRHKGVIP